MAHVPRLYHSGALGPGPVIIDGEAAKRLATVMRLAAGSDFLVFSGDGREWRAVVESVGKARLSARVDELARQASPPAVVLETWIALVRASRFEIALEKCVEAGADIIRPLICEFSQRGDGASPTKRERWQRIIVEATEQSGRLYLPVLQDPAPFARALESFHGALTFGALDGRAPTDVAGLLPATGHLAFATGPEGGFSPAETALLQRRGAIGVALGPYILRTETAAIAGTALLRALTAPGAA